MPIVTIVQDFWLFLEETGERILVKAGAQDLPENVASHWYTKANIQKPATLPGVGTLQPRLEAEQALRNAQVELRAHTDAAASSTAIDAAYKDALAASEARNAELQRKLDQHMQEAAAVTQAQMTNSDTAHSGASSQRLVPTQGEAPAPGVEVGGESDEVLRARAMAESKGLVVGKTDTGLPPANPEQNAPPGEVAPAAGSAAAAKFAGDTALTTGTVLPNTDAPSDSPSADDSSSGDDSGSSDDAGSSDGATKDAGKRGNKRAAFKD